MKVIAFAALLYCVSGVSIPQEEPIDDIAQLDTRNSRFVDNLVSAAIEDVSQQIRDAGLDPFHFSGLGRHFVLPVENLFDINVLLENVRVTGLSNIVINSISYGLLNQRLTLDVSLPDITISIGNAFIDIKVLGNHYVARTMSRLSIIQPRVWGVIQVNVLGIIGGGLVRSIDLEFELERIEYDGFMTLQGMDYAPAIRQFVSYTIPNALRNMKAEINELVEIIAWELVESILS